jgi:RNA polymerase sigma factor (sigma-70 family)
MVNENRSAIVRGIERVFNHGSATGLTEGQLLRQFAAWGDESAFEALVTRHGPMVLAVCRRLLYDPRDVEDAFQATFLVLLRRAGSLRDADPLSPWLHGVAYRVAARIRARSARRPAEERKTARPEALESSCDIERHELRGILDEEIGRLPEKYRRPVVLCYLEGQTHEQAARRLHCTEGAVRGRLDRARERLKSRLTRRGVAPSTGLIASVLAGDTASASVPASWIVGTVATLGRAATARAVSATVSAAALELADGVFRAMILAKLKLAASFVVAAAVILAVGAVVLTSVSHSIARDGQDGLALVASKPQSAPNSPGTPESGQARDSIDYRVVDKRTSRPIPGVTLIVRIDGKETQRLTTDEAGRATIPLPTPAPERFMDVLARKNGFAPVRTDMRRPGVVDDIPAAYTLAMLSFEAIGGVVRDEQGRPIAGVTVKPMIFTRHGSDIRPTRETFEQPKTVRTDAQGRWRWETLPAGIEPDRVSFQFSHPDYPRLDLPTDKGLEIIRRDGVTILRPGMEVSGRVVDSAGKPIPGARILRGETRFGGDVARAETDADGRFRFLQVPAGAAVLTIQAPGHAPDLKKVDVRPGLAPIASRLEKGRMIRGHVVNRKGEPLAGASVSVDFWREHQTLDWQTRTDDEGDFHWDHAPSDAVSISISLEGYLDDAWHPVEPNINAVSITLVKQLKVRGTVVDAETRHAIKSFILVPGMESRNGFSTIWERERSRTVNRGQYEVRFEDALREDGRRIRIEAEGYMPEVSRVIHDDEDEPVVNFALHKGAGVSGIVHLPDKSPLAGADVVLVLPSQPAFIKNGRPPTGIQHRLVKSGADGRFTFPPQEPPYTILVLHDRGFAEQTQTIDGKPAANYDLTIKPWGRIEGTLRIGNRPGAGEPVSLSYDQQGDTPKAIPWWSGEATTDPAGRFTLERVIPGAVHVGRIIPVKTTPTSTTLYGGISTEVDIAPNMTTRVTIGGTGRPLIGKLTAPAEIAGQLDWIQSDNSLIVKATPGNRLSTALRKLGGSGGRFARRSYSVILKADGSFRVEDVEAGSYDLIFVVDEPSRDPRGFAHNSATLGSARREVTVPEMPGGRSDEPLDLGTIPLEPIKK